MKLFGTLSELVKVAFRSGGRETKLDAATQTGSQTDVTFRLPDLVNNSGSAVVATIVEKDLAQTLTNKTLSGSSNTFSNIGYSSLSLANSIVNADISSSTTIDGSKLQAASSSNAGAVTTGAQTIAGVKTFSSNPVMSGLTASQAVVTDGSKNLSSLQYTDANTASTLVSRNASGNFSAGTITATSFSGPLTGNVTGNVSGTSANVTGTVAIANGGTGQTTQQAALNALAGTQVSGRYLRSDGTNTSLSSIQAADVPTLNQNTTGTAANVTGIVAPANGGTGITSLGSGVATFLGTPSSANLASAVTDETGSGSLVFGTSPTLSSPQVNSSLVVQRISTPSNPSAGFDKIYTKSDGLLYKLDSAGNEVAVGSGASGSGEINAVLNPSAATDTTGWAAGTSHTVTKDSSNSPLSGIVSTSFAISSSAAVALGSQTSTSGVYDAITLPSGLQNRKLKVEFFFTTPASSAGTWAVALYQGSTKLALSTDSAGDTILPAGVTGGKFTAYFDSSSSSGYSLNLVQRTRTTTNTLYITNVVVGPGIQPQGAVVGEWLSYTPSSAITNTTNVSGRYQRVGSSCHIQLSFKCTGNLGSTYTPAQILPPGLTLNTSAVASAADSNGINYGKVFFTVQHQDFGVGTRSVGASAYRVDTNVFDVNYSTPPGVDDAVSFSLIVPIAEWAGSGTVQLAQNDVEYAFNSSTSTTASDTTSFGYGPGGAQVQSITASILRRVRFQSPIQAGDQLFVEISEDRAKWVTIQSLVGNAGGTYTISPYVLQNGINYGIGRTTIINSTDVDVWFGQYADPTSTYGAAGRAWSAGGSGWFWRLRKQSAGAAVGFGIVSPGVSAGLVSASGLPGRTDGNPIASGYVGEVDTQTQTSNVSLVSGGSAATTAKTLQPGNYLLVGTISINVSSNNGAINCAFAGQTKSVFSLGGVTASTGNARISFMVPVRISTATAYSFSVFSAGTVTGTISGTDQDTTWSAIRIA